MFFDVVIVVVFVEYVDFVVVFVEYVDFVVVFVVFHYKRSVAWSLAAFDLLSFAIPQLPFLIPSPPSPNKKIFFAEDQ